MELVGKTMKKNILSEFANYYKEHPKIFISFVILIIVLISFIFALVDRMNQPKIGQKEYLNIPDIAEVVSPSNELLSEYSAYDGFLTVGQKTKYNIPTDKVSIYEYSSGKLNQDTAKTISSVLGLSIKLDREDPVFGRMLIANSSDESQSLVVYTDQNKFIYTRTYNNVKGMKLLEESAKNSAENFMKKIGINAEQYKFNEINLIKMDNAEPQYAKNENEAVVMELTYWASQKGIRIIDRPKSATANTLKFWITDNGTVVKAEGNFIGNVGNQIQEVDLKPKETIITDINGGRAKLIGGYFEYYDKPSRATADSINLYYYNYSGRLIPVYVIYSSVTTSDNNISPGYFILDAIR